MRFGKRSDPILPKYSYIPLASIVCMTFLTYYGTKLVAFRLMHFDFSLPVDHALPFLPLFVLFYVLAFLQWAISFLLIARDSRELCYRLLAGEFFSKLICMALFLLIPTTMARPEIHGDDFFSTIVGYLYQLDTPDNLFPSIHCLESWLCFRASLQIKKVGTWYKVFSLIFSILVFASTVFIKQHVLVDIFAGVFVCEIGQYISKKANLSRAFEKIESRFH